MLQVTVMSRREVAPRDGVGRRQGCPRGNGNLGVDGAQETVLLQGQQTQETVASWRQWCSMRKWCLGDYCAPRDVGAPETMMLWSPGDCL